MENFWPSCAARLQKELTSQQFNTWIKPLTVKVAEGSVEVTAPNRFVMQWVKDKFFSQIQRLAEEYFARPVPISLVLGEGQPAPAQPPRPQPSAAPAAPAADHTRLNPAFTFDSFVAGRANQLARAAALQIGEHLGTAYNPLFVYGGVGLGKTHLIQAIGNFVKEQQHHARISYIHAERYVSDVVRAYQHKAFDEFKRYYHSLDLLLIDDIQFFSGKTRTQEEFFYAFNALIETKKQVVITCDTYPKEIAGMEDRLISRFGWGLTVAIEPPELEMRVAILLKKACAEKVKLDENVAFFIAKQVRSNVRELEGAMKRVIAYARFNGQPISLELTKEALKDLLAVQKRLISIENIQKTVADYYKIKVAEMYSKKRSRNIARPRQMAMALAKELTQHSLPDIGDAFGGRDHTTVLHACRKISELKKDDPGTAKDFALLLQVLTS
ncbi:MAG: chromosomal replication initiator protein DnaA [Betaproteobacteria bacterium]|nr:chromosomal replication initiator protein DnaA [Betaproteobacteria bacterium]